jgi:hypothetical protein
MKKANDSNEWTEQDVADMICNPVYAGVGAPRILSDDKWVSANVKAIAELGAERYLRNLLRVLHEMFPSD